MQRALLALINLIWGPSVSGWEQSLWDGTPEGRTEEKGAQKKMVAKRRSWKGKEKRVQEKILEG